MQRARERELGVSLQLARSTWNWLTFSLEAAPGVGDWRRGPDRRGSEMKWSRCWARARARELIFVIEILFVLRCRRRRRRRAVERGATQAG